MGASGVSKVKKPSEGMFGNFKGSPKKLLNEFNKAKAEKGELEGLRSVRKKYNIKSKYTYPREAKLLSQKEEEEKGFKLGKTSLLGA